MEGLFVSALSFDGDISMWDMSSVIDTCGMFYKADKLNSDISNWDVSNVLYMDAMFYDAESFNQDLSSWNVSNVESHEGFSINSLLKEEYLPRWKD